MSAKGKISISLVVFLVPALAITFFFFLSDPESVRGAAGDEILNIDTTTLTTSGLSGPSGGQNVSPTPSNRGVGIDGALRLTGSFPLALAGNPFKGPGCGAGTSKFNAGLGSYTVSEIDIALPSEGFSWVIGRSFNNLQEDSGHHESSGYQGVNWFQNSQPEIQLNNDRILLIYRADAYLEYKRVSTTNYYKGTNGAAGMFEYKSGSPDTYELTDQHSNKMTFFGFNTADSGRADGQIWKVEDPDGHVAYVGHESTASTAQNSYTAQKIVTAYDDEGRKFTYDYTSGSLDFVKVEVNDSGWTEVARVDYTYYSSSDDGPDGALEMATVKEYLTDSGITVEKVKHYRYYKGSYNGPEDEGTDNLGHNGALKLILGYEGCRAYDYEYGTPSETFDDTFLTADLADLKAASEVYLEYDSNRKINLANFGGNCGCGGSNVDGTYEYTYETNSSHPGNSGYDEEWKYRTIVERPLLPDSSDSFEVLYFDEIMQPLSTALADGNPSGSPTYWVTGVDRNASGLVTTITTPPAIASYTHSTGAFTTETATGLIREFEYYTGTDPHFGFLKYEKWKEGSGDTANYQIGFEYDSSNKINYGAPDTALFRPFVSKRKEYQAVTTVSTNSIDWSFSTDVYSNTLATEEVTTTEPAVTTSKNGSNSSNTTVAYFDKQGRVIFTKDQESIIGYRKYENGLLVTSIRDVDTSHSDLTGVTIPSGFTSSGTEIHQKTTHTYDEQGRRDITTTPDGRNLRAYHSRLKDNRLVTLSFPDYDDLTTDKYYGPVSYSVRNHAGHATATALVKLTSNETTATPSNFIDETDDNPITAADLGTVTRLVRNNYAEAGTQIESTWTYFDVPTTGSGTNGTNYDQTTYDYNDLGQQTHREIPSGTIYKTEFDIHGRVDSEWIGTDDGSPGNMVKTVEYTYDADSRFLTKTTRFIDDTTTDKRETAFTNDVHGRALVINNPQNPDVLNKYDNNGRLLASGLYKSTPTAGNDPTSTSSNRIGLTQTAYDELGRPYETKRHKIDASDGSDDDNLTSNTWYDASGEVIKVEGEQLQKFTYDRLGRRTHVFTLASDNDSTYSDTDDVTGDKVLVESQTMYDGDHSRPLATATITRDHDDTSGTGALDTDNDALAFTFTPTDKVDGRLQVTAMWYDQFLRLGNQVRYGTHGESNFDRDGLAVPARSETALRTSYTYNTAGQVEEIEDPKSIVTRYEYDDQLRRTQVIENYDATVNSGNPSDPDDNKTTAYTYTDQLMTELKADLEGTSDDQTTTYTYGTTITTPTPDESDSKIHTGHLLFEVKYPDSSGPTDVVTYAYNAQSQLIWKKDQAGSIFEYTYDTGGRLTKEEATTIASGFDTTVDERNLTYTDLGQVDKVNQGATSVTDEVQFSYDGWGLITDFDQDHNSAMGVGSDQYDVTYAYAKATGGRHTLRATSMTYPSGKQVNFDYDSGIDSDSSRVSEVTIGTSSPTTVASYAYQGFTWRVRTDYDEIDVFNELGSSFSKVDRFNRVTKSEWEKDLTTDISFYDVDISYDENSNITVIEDNIHVGLDVEYTKDDLNRLTQAEEGTWSGSSISTTTRDQKWTLNLADVMEEDRLDLNGDGDYLDTSEYDDDRTYNKANELVTRSSPGSYTLDHDAVGNMTDDKKSYEYKYDVFNRLVEVRDTDSPHAVVAEYRYNGLGHRIAERKDTNGDGGVDANDHWFHIVYDTSWRQIATYRLNGSLVRDTYPKEEFVHHQAGAGGAVSNLDAVVLRDKDANTAWTTASDGTLEDRIYYCQNWRGDVSAIVDDSGHMVEWIKYSAYGVPFGLPWGNTDSDTDRDSTDNNQVMTWVNTSTYDERGDTDLDGDVDMTDATKMYTNSGTTMGRSVLSDVGNRRGYAGYEFDEDIDLKYHIRDQVYSAELERWLTRGIATPGGLPSDLGEPRDKNEVDRVFDPPEDTECGWSKGTTEDSTPDPDKPAQDMTKEKVGSGSDDTSISYYARAKANGGVAEGYAKGWAFIDGWWNTTTEESWKRLELEFECGWGPSGCAVSYKKRKSYKGTNKKGMAIAIDADYSINGNEYEVTFFFTFAVTGNTSSSIGIGGNISGSVGGVSVNTGASVGLGGGDVSDSYTCTNKCVLKHSRLYKYER